MTRTLLALAVAGCVTACASPTFNMTPQQVAALSDDQLCAYDNSYRSETKMSAEIARRGLNCDRYYRECLRRGNQPNTEAMAFCQDILRQNERMRYEAGFDRYGYRDNRGWGSGVGAGVGFGF